MLPEHRRGQGLDHLREGAHRRSSVYVTANNKHLRLFSRRCGPSLTPRILCWIRSGKHLRAVRTSAGAAISWRASGWDLNYRSASGSTTLKNIPWALL